MSFTFTLGYWLIPTFVTIVAFLMAYLAIEADESSYNSLAGAFFAPVVMLLFTGIAIVVSLVSWCIYFAAT